MTKCGLVDPFFGVGNTFFPDKQGLAATWFFPKAQTGNNHPGACLPFGMVSVCPYSGAYVTGYGTNEPNSHGRPPRLFDRLTATGFTHFHPSGTGATGSYYNYFRVIPQISREASVNQRYTLVDESATPGYYTARLQESGVRAELSVTASGGAFHRYSFPAGVKPRILIDFASGGLALERLAVRPVATELAISGASFEGHIVIEGIAIYICGMISQKIDRSYLFINSEKRAGNTLSINSAEAIPESFGVALEPVLEDGEGCDLRLAFSLRDIGQARRNLASFVESSLREVRTAASIGWEQHLGRIQVVGNQVDQSLFYSALYHSLIKPCHLNQESPFYEGSPFYADFATLWDQYKTALPLILTLFADSGSAMINSMLAMAESFGFFPNAVLLSTDLSRCKGQARGLAHHLIADAWVRNLPGIDWRRALDCMVADLNRDDNRDFRQTGIAQPATHTLDLAVAAFCTALLADGLGNRRLRDRIWPWTVNWQNVYDRRTGILAPSTYYEGGAWNYSFRLLHDMAGRIALHRGDDRFVRDLEKFFGYGQPPVRQQVDPSDLECMEQGFALNRFEGFNNEPDMETPYAFVYAGRHDRTCEVIREAMKWQFHTGRGGLPGNNDSGGLTSAYVWNAIGLFPVAGQPLVLIGSPQFEEIQLFLPQNEMTIRTEAGSVDNIYVVAAKLNGKKIDRAFLTMQELLRGGELVLTMAAQPEGWASRQKPPSYSRIGQLGQDDD